MRRLWLSAAFVTIAASMASAQQRPSEPATAADTLPAAVVQRFVDAANARDAAAMATLVAPDASFARFPDVRIVAQGRDGIEAFYARMLPALSPGFRIVVEPRVVEGHLVIDQEHLSGT